MSAAGQDLRQALVIPRPRGEDFSRKQAIGSWAERIVCAWVNESGAYSAGMYGTSAGEAFASREDFAGAYREHKAREGNGKRPDVMVWRGTEPVSAIEVKCSKAPSAGRKLNVVIKCEEVGPLHEWCANERMPVVIAQLFPDAMYAMSFKRFVWAVRHPRQSHARCWHNEETNKSAWYVPLYIARYIGSIAGSVLMKARGGEWDRVYAMLMRTT